MAVRQAGGEDGDLAYGCDNGEGAEDGAEDTEDLNFGLLLLGRLDKGDGVARRRLGKRRSGRGLSGKRIVRRGGADSRSWLSH